MKTCQQESNGWRLFVTQPIKQRGRAHEWLQSSARRYSALLAWSVEFSGCSNEQQGSNDPGRMLNPREMIETMNELNKITHQKNRNKTQTTGSPL